jgi:hypothetical protein
LQAFWRGLLTRKRFRQTLLRVRYVDDDDFDYIGIDENEFAFDPTILEENFMPFKFQAINDLKNEKLSKRETNSKDINQVTESIQDNFRPSLYESIKYLAQSDEKLKIEVKESTKSQNKKSLKDIPQCILQSNSQHSKIESNIKAKASCTHF